MYIWGGWHVVDHANEKLLFSGEQTMAMAHEICDKSNPDNKQMQLL
jgi:hypothetical protein